MYSQRDFIIIDAERTNIYRVQSIIPFNEGVNMIEPCTSPASDHLSQRLTHAATEAPSTFGADPQRQSPFSAVRLSVGLPLSRIRLPLSGLR